MATNFFEKRRRSQELNELQLKFRAEDNAQMFADFVELMKLPAFQRVLIGMCRRAGLEKSVVRTDDPRDTDFFLGYREFAVQLAESAKGADYANWIKADRDRREIEMDRKARLDAFESETKGNER